MKRALIVIAVAVGLLWCALLVTGQGILVGGTLVKPGQEFHVEGHGNLGAHNYASLVCRYFNGRQILPTVFSYAPQNFMGRDTCPFIWRNPTR